MSGEPTAENDPDSRHGPIRHKHRRTPKRAYLMGASGLVLGIFLGFPLGSESIPPAPLPSQGGSGELETPTETTIPGDGTFLVGYGDEADVRPGLYHSSGNATPCEWRRAKDATFEDRALLAHDTSLGDAYVQLKEGDVFDSTDCTTWHLTKHPAGPG